jgi:hypothetical protein
MSYPTEAPTEFVLVLTPTGPGPPGYVRLRRFLKSALRAHGLRCTEAIQRPRVGHARATTADGAGGTEER